MANTEQIAYLEGLLSPWYNLETGEPLHELSPFPDEIAVYLSVKEGNTEERELYV